MIWRSVWGEVCKRNRRGIAVRCIGWGKSTSCSEIHRLYLPSHLCQYFDHVTSPFLDEILIAVILMTNLRRFWRNCAVHIWLAAPRPTGQAHISVFTICLYVKVQPHDILWVIVAWAASQQSGPVWGQWWKYKRWRRHCYQRNIQFGFRYYIHLLYWGVAHFNLT